MKESSEIKKLKGKELLINGLMLIGILGLILLTLLQAFSILELFRNVLTIDPMLPNLIDYCKEPLPFHIMALGLIFLNLFRDGEKRRGWFIVLVSTILTYDIMVTFKMAINAVLPLLLKLLFWMLS